MLLLQLSNEFIVISWRRRQRHLELPAQWHDW